MKEQMLINKPEALELWHLLTQLGHNTWFVGGCVRDALLGSHAHDFDFATTSSWQELEQSLIQEGIACFRQGIRFGTLGICYQGQTFEVTTTRQESKSSDFRHPSELRFGVPIEQDLARRDFTINALAWSPDTGLIDPFNGRQDLKDKVLRAVGAPKTRFTEDALRILRCLRFASTLGFKFDKRTEQALFECAPLLEHISAERIKAELDKLLCGDGLRKVFLDYADILFTVLPELAPCQGFKQHNPYHCYDVLEHTLVVTESLPKEPRLRWAGLVHDIGKPACFTRDDSGCGHFYGHPERGAEICHELAQRLKFSREERICLELLVRYHDTQFEISPLGALQAFQCMSSREEWLQMLCELKRADELGKRPSCSNRLNRGKELWECFLEYQDKCYPLSLKELAVTGDDVVRLTGKTGKDIREVLQDLQSQIWQGSLSPNREDLIQALKEFH